MVAYARSQFELNTVQKDGNPLRVHLEKAANGMFPSKEAVAQLESVAPFPPLAAQLWDLFTDLDTRRVYTMDGPQRFTYEAIQAYQNVTGSHINGFQLSVIFAVENAFFEVYADRPK